MKVCKFGGTSLADAEAVRKVCDIVLSDADRRLVVVSAPGKRSAGDVKITDLLIVCAQNSLAGQPWETCLDAVVTRFADIEHALGIDEGVAEAIERDLRARLTSLPDSPAAFLDLLKAAGEDNNAKLVAAALRARGCDAVYVDPRNAGMRLTAEFGNAQLLPESFSNLARLRVDAARKVVVFPGFFGYTPDDRVVTFPRGGSDITGAILAAAVQAEAYENFTDVDSVYSADPRIVPNAKPIEEMTFREMRELAYAGFSVLHEEAILPAVRAGVPIFVKNSNRPDLRGTQIVPRHRPGTSRVVGIASSSGFCTLYVQKYLMNREVGFGRRLLQIFEDEGLSFEHTPSGIDNMSVVLREAALTPEKEQAVLARIGVELNVNDMEVERGQALVMVVGEGMRYAVGIAARTTGALAKAGVNIEMMNQGSSEISMMFGVKAADRESAVRAIHNELFETAS